MKNLESEDLFGKGKEWRNMSEEAKMIGRDEGAVIRGRERRGETEKGCE